MLLASFLQSRGISASALDTSSISNTVEPVVLENTSVLSFLATGEDSGCSNTICHNDVICNSSCDDSCDIIIIIDDDDDDDDDDY